ncbi:hypothetical protein [Mumia sp. DW29H23]|uniref:hypothetical protein n=1 Tax=Mumia sp. DW29H23 TaxID=3421241 RepID=UPI003D69BBE3
MTNASNEPLDVGPDEAINDDAPETDEIRSSADADVHGTGDASDRGAVVDDDDQDSEPSSNAPAGEAPNDPSGA